MPNELPTNTKLISKSGFSLVELLISLFFIVTLVVILYSLSGSQLTRYESNVQSVASKVATKEIERLRSTEYESLIKPSPCSQGAQVTNIPLTPAEQDRLKNGVGTTTIDCYQSPNEDIMQITVKVTWLNSNDGSREITMDTLIYKDGL